MKRFAGAFLLALALPMASFAATKNSASVTIYEAVHVGAKTLPAGDYTLHWTDGSGVVDLNITGNRQNVTVPVTVTARAAGPTNVMTSGEGNATVLHGFQTKSSVLTIQDPEAKKTGN